jgi:hypothetical protein
MGDCNMACCQDSQVAPVTPVAYVLPTAVTILAANAAVPDLLVAEPDEITRSLAPLSPPPEP